MDEVLSDIKVGDTIIINDEKHVVEKIINYYKTCGYRNCTFMDTNGEEIIWWESYDGGKVMRG